MIKPFLKPLLIPLIKPILGDVKKTAYYFSAQNEYAQLQNRALDFSLDKNVIRFKTGYIPNSVTSGENRVAIVVQQLTNTTFVQREFYLINNSSGFIQFLLGGTFNTFTGLSLLPNCHYEIEINKAPGDSFGRNLTTGFSISRQTSDGGAREPFAPTIIGSLVRPGVYEYPMIGQLYDIELNGVKWSINNPSSETQSSTPAGNNLTLINMRPENWQPLSSIGRVY